MNLSVIICSHNPRPDYLERTLNALRAQTLPKEQWELLLIDNASKKTLAESWDLSWHPHVRIIREEELGLTPARLRGIKESKGDILIFVDDDNLLNPDYLANAVRIGLEHPKIGVWGGELQGEFEGGLPEWLEPHTVCLAVRSLQRDAWSNLYGWSPALPAGAGMTLRRVVGEFYANLNKEHPLRRQLDRRGKSLGCGGDVDLAYSAIDLGFGIGRFKCLQILHCIPERRIKPEYVLNMTREARSAAVIVDSLRTETQRIRSRNRPLWCNIYFLRQWLRAAPFERSLMLAAHRGEAEAWRLLEEPQKVLNPMISSQSMSETNSEPISARSFNPEIALVVKTKNHGSKLDPFFEALRKMNSPCPWELILVDNGSTDDTPIRLKAFMATFQGQVNIISEPRPGTGLACNTGWRATNASIIAFTDDDCYPEPDYLERISDVLDDPEVGIAGGRILLYDPTDAPVTINESQIEQVFNPGSFVCGGVINGANMAFRRQALVDINGFDDDFSAGEDVDAVLRTLAAGWKGKYDPRPLVYHHHRRKHGIDIQLLHKYYDTGRGKFYMKCILFLPQRWQCAWFWLRCIRRQSPAKTLREVRSAIQYFFHQFKHKPNTTY